MGSQFNNFERKFLNVVPSVKGNSPALNSLINRFAYASSSVVHFPLRNGWLPFFLEEFPPEFPLGLLLLSVEDVGPKERATCVAGEAAAGLC